MKNTFKGLLIDPTERTITEVETDGGLKSMYALIGCTCVDMARGGFQFLPSNPTDDLWFDDEGLYSDCMDCFVVPGMVPLIGKGLILGYNDDGDSIGHSLTEDDIFALRHSVEFISRNEAGR